MRTAHILQKGDVDHKYGQSLALKQAWWFESLRDALYNGFARFSYFKMDGTSRTAIGTRSPYLIPADKMPKRDTSDYTDTWESAKAIPYFDLDRNEWRSFNILNFNSLDKVWKINEPLL